MITKLLRALRRCCAPLVSMALLATVVGCQAPPVAPPASNDAVPLEQAVGFAVGDLAAQLKKMPGLLARMEARRPVLAVPRSTRPRASRPGSRVCWTRR